MLAIACNSNQYDQKFSGYVQWTCLSMCVLSLTLSLIISPGSIKLPDVTDRGRPKWYMFLLISILVLKQDKGGEACLQRLQID